VVVEAAAAEAAAVVLALRPVAVVVEAAAVELVLVPVAAAVPAQLDKRGLRKAVHR
jgi:hypothetical protein